jgi:hypothetical protein
MDLVKGDAYLIIRMVGNYPTNFRGMSISIAENIPNRIPFIGT